MDIIGSFIFDILVLIWIFDISMVNLE